VGLNVRRVYFILVQQHKCVQWRSYKEYGIGLDSSGFLISKSDGHQ
jgi:hypothetical protein